MLDTQKHAGLVNLAFVIIVATNVRQILENLLKYGFSFRPMRLLFSEGKCKERQKLLSDVSFCVCV